MYFNLNYIDIFLYLLTEPLTINSSLPNKTENTKFKTIATESRFTNTSTDYEQLHLARTTRHTDLLEMIVILVHSYATGGPHMRDTKR